MRRFNISVVLALVAALASGRAYAQSYQQELSDAIKPSGTVDTGTTDQRMIQVAGSNAGTALKILTDAAGNLTTAPAAGAAATPVNLTQTNGVAQLVNTGPTGAGSERVTVAVDAATVAGSASLPTGANTIGAVDVRVGGGAATGNTGVVGANTQRVTLATDVALPTGANVIGALSANQTVDVNRIAGTATAVGNGPVGAGGVQRVSLASDSTGQVTLATGANVIGALTANQSVNEAQINGVAPTMGNGPSGLGVQRVTLASDSTGQVALAAGAATIGALTANQSVNVAQMNGVATTMGIGISGTGVQRVVLANDQPVIPVSDNAGSLTVDAAAASFAVNVGQINGVAPTMDNGVSGAGVQRVTIASNSTGTINTSSRTATVGTGASADSDPPNTLTSVLMSCVTSACILTLRVSDVLPCASGSIIQFKAAAGASFFVNFTEPPAFSALCIDADADANVSSFVVTTR